MKVVAIPSSLVADGAGPFQYLTSYLINETVALDAGCLGLFGSPTEQARVKHLLLSHTHADHLASLPIFLENAYSAGGGGVTVLGSEAVLDCLRRDLFNGRLWPDFARLSALDPPYLRLVALTPGEPVQIEDLHVTPVAVNHSVPTLGFLIEDASAAVAFSSDTGPTEALWRLARQTANLKAVFLEASFPDSMAGVGEAAKHLTPARFALELEKLQRPVRAIAVHLKPLYREQIVSELRALGLPGLEIVELGKAYQF